MKQFVVYNSRSHNSQHSHQPFHERQQQQRRYWPLTKRGPHRSSGRDHQSPHQQRNEPSIERGGTQRAPARSPRKGSNFPREDLIPAEFFHLTREHFAVIKSRHHLHRLSEVPVNLQRAATNLAQTARPAFRNDYYDIVAKSLAEDWLQATLQSLREHYLGTIDASLSAIKEAPLPAKLFQRSLALCTKWAHRQLGRRLDPNVLDAALSEITAAQTIEEQSNSLRPSIYHTTRTGSRTISTQTMDLNEHDIRPSLTSLSQKTPLEQEEELRPEEPLPEPTPHNLDPHQPQECAPTPSAILQDDSTQQPTLFQPSASTSQEDTSLRPRARKRQLVELSQLDLFGEVCTQSSPPRQRSRSLSLPRSRSPASLSPSSTAVILGDENLTSLRDINADILALPNGRLNHFRNLLRTSDEEFQDVRHFVITASHLDRLNLPASNSKAISHIFAMAARIFPNAKRAYICDGPCSCQPEETRVTLVAFNSRISTRPPKGCSKVILPPAHFSCENGVWNEATKTSYYDILRSFLDQ